MANVDNGSVQNRDTDWRWWSQRGDQNFIKDENMFRADIDLQRRIFIDGALHSGYKVEYFATREEIRDGYYDPITTWEESVILPCFFEDFPKPKILKSYGWFQADQETQSQLLYLPMYRNWETKEILDIKDQSLFRVTYFGQNTPADFRLVEKRFDSFYGVYQICRLAPEHLDNFYYVTDHGSHYLKRKKDSKSSEHESHKEETKKDRRIYQNEDIETYLFGKKGEDVSDQRILPKEEITTNNQEEKTYSQLIMEDDD